jgi:hypothetical protein
VNAPSYHSSKGRLAFSKFIQKKYDDHDHHDVKRRKRKCSPPACYTTVTHPDSGSLRARLVVRGRVNDDLRNDDSARGMMSPQNVGDGEPNDLVGG